MSHMPRRVLLAVNLGTPDAPTATAVRRYLAEFLGDRRVVNMPPAVWKPILHGAVLPLRSPRSARLYEKIWTQDGSPLLKHTVNLAERIGQKLPEWEVIPAMTYGEPSLRSALEKLADDDVEQIVVLPLYPQYSTSTTASIFDIIDTHGAALPIATVNDYYSQTSWVSAVADSIRAFRSSDTHQPHLLFSFHGLPQKVVDNGDPYRHQCEASANAIADELGLARDEWSMSFQSRFGPAKWLQPATTDQVDRLAADGVTHIDVVCPGFAVDCLETLEEIAIRLAEQYAEHNGTMRYIPCLNDSDAHAETLADVAVHASPLLSPPRDQQASRQQP